MYIVTFTIAENYSELWRDTLTQNTHDTYQVER